jgi:sec-independent protein translocase protein TatA
MEVSMPNIGATELIIILIIVVLLFGIGRLGKIGGELGTGIREFRKGLKDDNDDAAAEEGQEPPEDEAP